MGSQSCCRLPLHPMFSPQGCRSQSPARDRRVFLHSSPLDMGGLKQKHSPISLRARWVSAHAARERWTCSKLPDPWLISGSAQARRTLSLGQYGTFSPPHSPSFFPSSSSNPCGSAREISRVPQNSPGSREAGFWLGQRLPLLC